MIRSLISRPYALPLVAGLALAAAPAAAAQLVPHKQASVSPLPVSQIAKVGYGEQPIPSYVRTSDGVLHIAYETNTNWGDTANGVGVVGITPSGQVQPAVQALTWNGGTPGAPNGVPGIADLPTGQIVVFGGSPQGVDGPWDITSSDGGATWSVPVNVGSGTVDNYGDGVAAVANSGGTPVIVTGCCGNLDVQTGLGSGTPVTQFTNGTDGSAGDADVATDGSGHVYVGWDSLDGSGGLWMQQVAPTIGSAVEVPMPTAFGTGEALIVAGRNPGSGAYAAYPANTSNSTTVKLESSSGTSVTVGSVAGLKAQAWGVATGPDGRIWVAWEGNVAGKNVFAFTRSNEAVTRFEPIQRYESSWSSLNSLAGDGVLGPWDLLLTGTPGTTGATSGIYAARVLALLDVHGGIHHLKGDHYAVALHVTDAGDAVPGAHVKIAGASGVTNAQGKVTVPASGAPGDGLAITVTAFGYHPAKAHLTVPGA